MDPAEPEKQDPCFDSQQTLQTELSAAMRAKIERNRQRALMLRQARLASRSLSAVEGATSAKVSKTVDSGAGFFIEEEEDGEEELGTKRIVQQPGVSLSLYVSRIKVNFTHNLIKRERLRCY